MVVVAVYCGVDIGSRSHAVGLLDKNQKKVGQYFIMNNLDGFQKLENSISKKTKICIEPTGIYSFNFFYYFYEKGYDIRLCETRSSASYRRSLHGPKKNDKRDCIALATYRITHDHMTFDGKKILSKYIYDNSSLFFSKLYDFMLLYNVKRSELKKLKNMIKILVDLRFPEAREIFPYDPGCKTITKALCHSKDEVLSGHLKLRRQDEIIGCLRRSIGQFELKIKEFRMHAEKASVLESELKSLTEETEAFLRANGYSRLFDFCGLNSINIATLLRDIQDIKRFFKFNSDGSFSKKKSLGAFKNFLGIAVTSNQSGEKEGAHKLVKNGCKSSRVILMMLALTYISVKDHPKYSLDAESEFNALNPGKYNLFYEEYCKRTRKIIAVTKIMNKIATDLFFVLKDVEESPA